MPEDRKPQLRDRLNIKKVGRPRSFKSTDDILKAAQEYFDWCDDSPFKEHKLFLSGGELIDGYTEKQRPYTQAGLCAWCGINVDTWHKYTNDPEYSDVCMEINDIMREQKLAGASAGIFNHAIVARDLGLADKKDITSDGKPVNNWVINPVTTKTAAD